MQSEMNMLRLYFMGQIASNVFKLSEIWYQKKAHIFLSTRGDIYSWKMHCLECINENVISYGNHN